MVRPRSFMAAAVTCLLAATVGAATVPVARDLVTDGALAGEQRIPILLLFTREDCGYCELLKRSVILPMIISGEYEGRVVIREVIVDDSGDLTDFAGRRVSPFAVADRYDALLTPTVIFVGPDGRALTERLVGINNEEMYLWYLDRALDDATTELRGR